jgi:hypothetical protein
LHLRKRDKLVALSVATPKSGEQRILSIERTTKKSTITLGMLSTKNTAIEKAVFGCIACPSKSMLTS